ncbi:ATP-dependent DNA helicase PIF1-like protein, partial [Tanacetum coccineum]
MDSVETSNGGVFFVYGYSGTGKTFLWKTLTAGIRWKCDVVLNVASRGIASLLMTGGRTAHSRFKFPINIDELSTCFINPQSDLAALVRKCKLIIWDEAPKTHKHCFEALDRSLRDVLRKSKHDTMDTPFGNMTVVFGGDFRQVLPVISKGSRQYIVGASLKQSYLWDHCKVLRLTANMRLTIGCRPEDDNEIKDFAEWILKLGDNNLGDANDGEAKIDIPDEILIKDSSDPVGSIIDFTYPNMLDNLDDNNYFTEKSILAPTNEVVETINDKMLKVILGEQVTYYSCDNVCKLEKGASINEPVFSTEFVNGLKFSSVPNHELKLKVGVPIMLLLNIDQSNSLCNGTRLRVDRLMKTAIHANIINGSHVGKQMLIARMRISPYNKRLPIKIVIVYFIMSVHGFTDDEYKASDDQPTLISKIDLSSPLHLHPNDSTTFTIVFVKLKGTENYQVWSCAILLALKGKNKTIVYFIMSVHGFTDDEYEASDDQPTLISKLVLSSPLHLHSNDSATFTIVSVKLKGTENYQVWSCAMLLALKGKNKIGFIDGSCRRSNTDEFLMGLDDCYMQIRSNILSRDELPIVRSAYAIISSEESHRRPQASVSSFRPSNVTRPVNSGNRRPNGGSPLVIKAKGFKPIWQPAHEQTGTIFDSFANQHLTYIDKKLVNTIDISYLGIKVSHPSETEALINKVARD